MKALSGFVAVLTLAFPAFLFADLAHADAPSWQVDKEHSTIGFSARYEDDLFSGKVSGYEIVVHFAPEDLKTSAVTVEFDMASVLTGNETYDASLPGAEWLNIAQFPTARFDSTSFDDPDPETGHYTLNGTFTLLGISKEISIPFSFAPKSDGNAIIDGSFQIHRADFGLGMQSSDSKALSDDIDVTIHLTASP